MLMLFTRAFGQLFSRKIRENQHCAHCAQARQQGGGTHYCTAAAVKAIARDFCNFFCHVEN